jgi:insulysin
MTTNLPLIIPHLSSYTYRALELGNHLRVVLVSVPGSDKSAAALCVHSGCFRDPKDRFGLSHFLEHMLFLGTAKYPNEAEYHEFLASHSGDDNAWTADDVTNYFFNVDANYFEEVLDRFSQFFIAPLFTESCTERELNAVHSEYKMNLNTMAWREQQLDHFLANEGSYYHMFSIGTHSTLHPEGSSLSETRQRLIDLYEKYYSARHMSLCLIGKGFSPFPPLTPLFCSNPVPSSHFSRVQILWTLSNDTLKLIFCPFKISLHLNLLKSALEPMPLLPSALRTLHSLLLPLT